jgi:hypothetical protein
MLAGPLGQASQLKRLSATPSPKLTAGWAPTNNQLGMKKQLVSFLISFQLSALLGLLKVKINRSPSFLK